MARLVCRLPDRCAPRAGEHHPGPLRVPEEIAAPPDGWAPPFFAGTEAAAAEEITAPPEGWAPPFLAVSGAAPAEEITAPPEGWAPPIYGLAAPVSTTTRAVLTPGAGRRWRGLRAHSPATLGVAGSAIATILAVAAKPHRTTGRRHR